MKDASDSAFVVSVHYESLENATRINLKWVGHHEISDFDFDHQRKPKMRDGCSSGFHPIRTFRVCRQNRNSLL
jgi:hypothetical protein